MKKKLLAIGLSVAMMVSSVVPAMATPADEPGRWGVSGTGELQDITLNVELPLSLDFVINPFGIDMGTIPGQISFGLDEEDEPIPGFVITNRSPGVPVAVVYHLTADLDDSVTLQPLAASAPGGETPALAAFEPGSMAADSKYVALNLVGATGPGTVALDGYVPVFSGAAAATIDPLALNTVGENLVLAAGPVVGFAPAQRTINAVAAAPNVIPTLQGTQGVGTANIGFALTAFDDNLAPANVGAFRIHGVMNAFAPWEDEDINVNGVVWLTPTVVNPETVPVLSQVASTHRLIPHNLAFSVRPAAAQFGFCFFATAPGFSASSNTVATVNVHSIPLTDSTIVVPFTHAGTLTPVTPQVYSGTDPLADEHQPVFATAGGGTITFPAALLTALRAVPQGNPTVVTYTFEASPDGTAPDVEFTINFVFN